MLSKDDFFNYLNDKVFTQTLDSPEEYKKAIGDSIREYLEKNTEILGIYSGLTPSVPPVPVILNGTATFQITSFILPYGTEAGMNPWWANWSVSLLQPAIKVVLNKPLSGTGIIKLTPLVIPKIEDITEIGNVWKPICETIINTIKSGIISSIPATCTSPTSAGMFTPNLIQ